MSLHLMNIQHKILMPLPDYLQRSKMIFKNNFLDLLFNTLNSVVKKHKHLFATIRTFHKKYTF